MSDEKITVRAIESTVTFSVPPYPLDADPRAANTPFVARVRRLWWQRVRRYPWEMCDCCGRPASRALGSDTYWFAPNELWNTVHGSPNGIRCPRCFTAACRREGISVGWRCDVSGEIE